jgi:hypothetical protein
VCPGSSRKPASPDDKRPQIQPAKTHLLTLIRLFTLRQPIVIVLLILLAGLLKLPFFLFGELKAVEPFVLSYTFFDSFIGLLNQSKIVVYLAGTGIIMLQALHLNMVFEKHGALNKNTFLPAYSYVICASLLPGLDTHILPALLAQTPLIICFDIFFGLYKSSDTRQKIFRAMLSLGLGVLIYLPVAYLIPAFLICIFFVKIPSVRDFIVGAAGGLLPAYFCFVYFYYSGNLQQFLDSALLLTRFETSFTFEETMGETVLLSFTGLALVLGAFKIYATLFRNIIKTRIIQQMMFVISLVTVGLLVFLLQLKYTHLLLFIVPFSYLLPCFFMGKWRFLLNEILALALIAFMFFLKFYRI